MENIKHRSKNMSYIKTVLIYKIFKLSQEQERSYVT